MAISVKVRGSLEGASWIRKMFEEGEEMKRLYGEENVFDFSLGNPDLEPPASFKERLKALVDARCQECIATCPTAATGRRGRRLRNISRKNPASLSLKDHFIMTGRGCRRSQYVFKAILDRDDEVIVPSPYFVEYRSTSIIAEGSSGSSRPTKTSP